MPKQDRKKQQLARKIVDTSCAAHAVGRGDNTAIYAHANTCTLDCACCLDYFSWFEAAILAANFVAAVSVRGTASAY